ncbi:accessory gene regulator ArgB-like protein [Paenibacillus ottowii]|uniref:Accessory regulator AgrB n=1 Tax=Paenibacillus ottowii TaxID=2315729 RepID=A0ABY3B4J6_9BACL|nr:accessory regulator AgrB [Paenibacillus polymyxa]TQR98813.1 accessory regulator AgrB [Paenibacillus ottowii]
MIETVALKLANQIKRTVPDHPASVPVLKYALALILNATMIIVLTLFASFFTGRMVEAVTILIAFALLRQVSGGIHLKTGMACVVVTSVAFTYISCISLNNGWTNLFTGIALILVLCFAPSRIEKQSRIPVRFYPLLRLLSSLLVCTNFVIGSSVVAVAFLLQSLTLIRGRR